MRTHGWLSVLALTAPLLIRAQVADAGPDQWTCFDTTSLQALAPLPGDTAYWSVTFGSATITDPSDPTSTVTDIEFGQNILTWTVISGVDTASDQMSIFLVEVSPAMADAGPDQIIHAPPFEATMNAVQPIFPQVCTWTVIQGQGIIIDPNDPNTLVTGLGLGLNVLEWVCDDGPCVTWTNADQAEVNVLLSTFTGTPPMLSTLRFDPVTGHLRYPGPGRVEQLAVVDIYGRTVHAQATDDVSALPPGCYVARVLMNGQWHTLRFAVAR